MSGYVITNELSERIRGSPLALMSRRVIIELSLVESTMHVAGT